MTHPKKSHVELICDEDGFRACFAMRNIYDDTILDARGKEVKQLHSVIGW